MVIATDGTVRTLAILVTTGQAIALAALGSCGPEASIAGWQVIVGGTTLFAAITGEGELILLGQLLGCLLYRSLVV